MQCLFRTRDLAKRSKLNFPVLSKGTGLVLVKRTLFLNNVQLTELSAIFVVLDELGEFGLATFPPSDRDHYRLLTASLVLELADVGLIQYWNHGMLSPFR